MSFHPSPIERRAFDRVKSFPEMTHVMQAQLDKGHAEYGGPIDDCGYARPKLVRETAAENADLIVYFEALTCPADVMRAAQIIASWLERELTRK